MKRASLLLTLVPALLPLLLATTAAQAQTGFGRLFNTAQERQALDARRGKAIAAASANAPGGAPATADAAATMAGLPPGLPAGMPPRMPSEMPGGAGPGMAPGMSPAMAPNMPPDTRPDVAQNMPDPSQANGSAAPDAALAPAPPEQLTMNGVLRTSSGRSTVWLNNVPQRGDANKFSNRNSKAVTVTLPSGKRVVLQPGQRYDLADGRVKDINQP
jgi:hypothetical protein